MVVDIRLASTTADSGICYPRSRKVGADPLIGSITFLEGSYVAVSLTSRPDEHDVA